MIVADAGAVLDLLLGQPSAAASADALASERALHVPEHFHVEAISGLRGLRQRGGLSEPAAGRALDGLSRLRAIRYSVLPLAGDIWALRDELSAYDAAYLALALRLEADLISADRGLAVAARRRGLLRE